MNGEEGRCVCVCARRLRVRATVGSPPVCFDINGSHRRLRLVPAPGWAAGGGGEALTPVHGGGPFSVAVVRGNLEQKGLDWQLDCQPSATSSHPSEPLDLFRSSTCPTSTGRLCQPTLSGHGCGSPGHSGRKWWAQLGEASFLACQAEPLPDLQEWVVVEGQAAELSVDALGPVAANDQRRTTEPFAELSTDPHGAPPVRTRALGRAMPRPCPREVAALRLVRPARRARISRLRQRVLLIGSSSSLSTRAPARCL